jgi:Spy/CpxP family protein refolding chaperone
MKARTQLAAALVGAALAIGSSQLLAHGEGYGYGPGMMGGWGSGYPGMGPGMMGGYGGYGGYGMGPGMMGGYGGYGMGPGMMYGYGMGPGMMYGYGYGPGYGGGPALNLSDDQRSKIDKIQEELRTKQWDLMGRIRNEYARRAEASDDATASKADDQIAALQQQMIGNATAARKQMDAVLTKEQRQQLRRGGY